MPIIVQLSVSNERVMLVQHEKDRLLRLIKHAEGVNANTLGSSWSLEALIKGQVDVVLPLSFDLHGYPHAEPEIIGFKRVIGRGRDVLFLKSCHKREGMSQFAVLIVSNDRRSLEPQQQVWLAPPEVPDESIVRQIIDFLNIT